MTSQTIYEKGKLISQRILVDDSSGVNTENAVNTVQTIVKLVKHRAPDDGVRLFYLSDHKIGHQNASSKELAKQTRKRLAESNRLKKHVDKSGISLWLSDMLRESIGTRGAGGSVIYSATEPPSLYILTNGIFPEDQMPEVAAPLRDSGASLRSSLSIVFIQVGEDDEQKSGEKALQEVLRVVTKEASKHLLW